MSRDKKHPLRRRMLELLVLVALGYVAYAALAWAMQGTLIFPRQYAGSPAVPSPVREGVEQWWLETEDGPVEAWFVLGAGRSPESPGPAAMFFHGNAELIDHNMATASLYTQRGISVLLAEYRGYGRSAGTPSQRAITADMVALRDRLAQRAEVDADRIVYHGRSLGGGVAVALAEKRAPAALVLESPFTSIAAMANRRGLPGFLARHPFRNDRFLRATDLPVLLLHGSEDEIVPVSHSRRLHEITPNSTLAVQPGSHLDFPRDWRAYVMAIESFLVENGVLPGEPGQSER